MAVQSRLDVQIRQLILSGNPKAIDSAVFLNNAAATADIAVNTVVAKNPTTGKWEPLTDVTAIDGTDTPRGIILDTIATADIVAADVAGVNVLVGGSCTVDGSLLVLENSLTLDSVTVGKKTIGDALFELGIYTESVEYSSQLENA